MQHCGIMRSPWPTVSRLLSAGAGAENEHQPEVLPDKVEMDIKRVVLLCALVLSLAFCKVSDPLRFGLITDLHYADKAPVTLPGVIEGSYPEENSYAVVELERNGRLLVDGYRKCADRILLPASKAPSPPEGSSSPLGRTSFLFRQKFSSLFRQKTSSLWAEHLPSSGRNRLPYG